MGDCAIFGFNCALFWKDCAFSLKNCVKTHVDCANPWDNCAFLVPDLSPTKTQDRYKNKAQARYEKREI